MHVTASLMQTPGVHRSRADIAALRKQIRARREAALSKANPYRSFFVRDLFDLSRWNTVSAERVAQTTGVHVWIERTEADRLRAAGVLALILDELTALLTDRTPPGSVDPERGIVPLSIDYFGAPPDVDGDGITDVLLLDIRDSFAQTGAFVAGFFDPADLTDGDFSNRRDLLYVDTRPTIDRGTSIDVQAAAATIAHELQHLIQAAYAGAGPEDTFVNEGLSEYAEILLGFPPRHAGPHLYSEPRTLLNWSYDAPLPDYARASLWTHFLFEQIGAQHAAALVQSPRIGLDGLQHVLQSAGAPSVETLFTRWGEALVAGDAAPAGTYRHPDRRHLRLPVHQTVHHLPHVEPLDLPPLSHRVLAAPLTSHLQVDLPPGAGLRIAAGETTPTVPLRLSTGTTSHSGHAHPHTTSVVLASNVRATGAPHGALPAGRPAADASASSAPAANAPAMLVHGRPSSYRRTIAYDDGTPDPFVRSATYLFLDPGEAIALPFETSHPAWLYTVATRVLFASEIQGSGVDAHAERRLQVEVRRMTGDGTPGALLAPPVTVDAGRPAGSLRTSLLRLDDRYAELSAVDGAFVVAVRAASPENQLAVALDRTAGPAPSAFLGGTEGTPWRNLSTVTVSGSSLEGFRPILRAHVAVDAAAVPHAPLQFRFDHDARSAWVDLSAPFPIDTERAIVAVRTPNGSYVLAEPDLASSDAGAGSTTLRYLLPLQNQTAYSVNASVWSRDGLQTASGTFTRALGADLGAADLGAPFPHPARGATVSLPFVAYRNVDARTDVYDLLGRRVLRGPTVSFHAGSHTLRVPLPHAAGTYFARVHLTSHDGLFQDDSSHAPLTRKIVVVR